MVEGPWLNGSRSGLTVKSSAILAMTDPSIRTMIEKVMANEEEHAEDMKSLLESLGEAEHVAITRDETRSLCQGGQLPFKEVIQSSATTLIEMKQRR